MKAYVFDPLKGHQGEQQQEIKPRVRFVFEDGTTMDVMAKKDNGGCLDILVGRTLRSSLITIPHVSNNLTVIAVDSSIPLVRERESK